MSLDPRSRERLEALGRSLPQKLPSPQQPNAASEPKTAAGRHRLEIEQDPEALFRELMTASRDGTVPGHLLERLKELEARRPLEPRRTTGIGAERAAPSALDIGTGGSIATPGKPSPRRGQNTRANPPRRPRLDPEQQALYSAFDDLLHDEDPDA